MDESAPAGAAGASGPVAKKRRLLRRIPTSVIVTLLGISLTAWLLPAFTRQWDDRQKAHDLSVSLIGESAAASAYVLTQGQDAVFRLRTQPPAVSFSFGSGPAAFGPLPPLERRWSNASLAIETKLRAYYPKSVVADWHAYDAAVDYTLARIYDFPEGTLPRKKVLQLVRTLRADGIVFPMRAVDRLADQHRQLENLMARLKASPHPSPAERRLVRQLPRSERMRAQEELVRQRATLVRTVRTNIAHLSLQAVTNYRSITRQILLIEQQLATRILHSHVSGYSTTWNDLLNDLFPF